MKCEAIKIMKQSFILSILLSVLLINKTSALEDKIMLPKFDKGYAVIIGISHYENHALLPEIRQAVNDAEDLYNVMTHPWLSGYKPEQVMLLRDKDATIAKIKEALKWLKENTREDSTIMVYFSGHGYSPESGKDFGLCAYDYNRDDTATYLDASYLCDALNSINCNKKIIILDCCHSSGAYTPGAISKDAAPAPYCFKSANAIDILGSGKGVVALAACANNQSSYAFKEHRNSIFTVYLLRALTGEGRIIRDGKITVFSVFNYVSQMVPWYINQKDSSIKQTPIFKTSGMDKDFAVAFNLFETSQNYQETTFMEHLSVSENCSNTDWTTIELGNSIPSLNVLAVLLVFEPVGFGDIVKGEIRLSDLDQGIEFNTVKNNTIPIPFKINDKKTLQYRITTPGKGVKIKLKGFLWFR